MFRGSRVVVVDARKDMVLDLKAGYAASHTDHDVWCIYAGHGGSPTLIRERLSVSLLLLLECLAESTDLPATVHARQKS
jgi:hypothetical protein